MKELVLDLGREVSPLRIIPISDIHLGDPLCDVGRFRDTLNYAKETGSKVDTQRRPNEQCVENKQI